MTIRPIIFSAAMVRALLDGRKTQTRRLATSPLAKAEPGDLLYVREAFTFLGSDDPGIFATYADYPDCLPRCVENLLPIDEVKWRPSIHMPRKHSRLTLDVEHVDTERLQDIDDHDAMSEGVVMGNDGYWTVPHAPIPRGEEYSFYYAQTPRETFAKLWRVLHGEKSWDENPKVAPITFRVHKCNVDQMAKGAV